MSTRNLKYVRLMACTALALLLSNRVSGQFTIYNRTDWNSQNTERYLLIGEEGDRVAAATLREHTLAFNPDPSLLKIGFDQVVWGSNSELAHGDSVIRFSDAVGRPFEWEFSEGVTAFGFEAMNNELYAPKTITVDYFNASTLLGSVTRLSDNSAFLPTFNVLGGEVQLFAVSDIRGITGVRVTTTGSEFSVGALRLGTVNGQSVPESGSLIHLVVLGSLLLVLVLVRTLHDRSHPKLS